MENTSQRRRTSFRFGLRLLRLQSVLLASLAVMAAFMSWTGGAGAMPIGSGASGADVYAMQAILQSMGYATGRIDGIYGPATVRAVRQYQQASGLAVTGEIDGPTFRSILDAYARSADTLANGTGGALASGLSEAEQEMFDLVNAARRENGLAPLTLHPELSKVARTKSADMAANGYFSHDSPTYGSPFRMMTDFGIEYRSAGENIACNRSAKAAHEALMNSPGHRANVLSADFTHLGIGIADGGPCGAMYTQMFLRP